LARRIGANAALAVQAVKAVVASTQWPDPDWAFDRQAVHLTRVAASEDALEGARAFTEKRAPVWRGQ
jgi:enoyl-CoA hydratase